MTITIYNVYYKTPGRKRFKKWGWYLNWEKAQAAVNDLQHHGIDAEIRKECAKG